MFRGLAIHAQFPTLGTPGPEKDERESTAEILLERPRIPLGEMLVGVPLGRLATNILGPFPQSTWGNKYVPVVTDYFMKWVEIITMVSCMEVILDEVTGCYGCPYDIHLDQGWN